MMYIPAGLVTMKMDERQPDTTLTCAGHLRLVVFWMMVMRHLTQIDEAVAVCGKGLPQSGHTRQSTEVGTMAQSDKAVAVCGE